MTPPDQMLPSTPMTGPSGPAKRRLTSQEQEVMLPEESYRVPADPSILTEEAQTPSFALHIARRHLMPEFGRRRL